MPTDDRDLLERWRGGDDRAGEALFERYYEHVSRFFANKVTADPADLIQETFIGCVRGRDRLREDASFRSYLFAIACNVLRNFYKSQRRDADRLDFGTVRAADLSPGPGTMIAGRKEQRLLLEALRSIPVEFQIVLELFYWEELTSAEIADIVGVPHGTLRTRIRRARQLLESELARLAQSEETLQSTVSGLEDWAAQIRAAHRPEA